MKHFTRLSWNSKGWKNPSGIANKCKGAGNNRLYECLHGFGWEDWLFHYIEHKDGYCYGFLQCFNNKNIKSLKNYICIPENALAHVTLTRNLKLFM